MDTLGLGIDPPQRTHGPSEVLANRTHNGSSRFRKRRRLGHNFTDGMRRRTTAVAGHTFSDGGGEKQAGARDDAQKDLQENQTLMDLGTGKGTHAVNRVPDGHDRGRQHDKRRGRLA